VTVTWPDGSTSTVKAGEDGSWSIPTPSGMISGPITVTATDEYGNVSDSTQAELSIKVEVETGGVSSTGKSGAGVVAAAFLLTVGVVLIAYRKVRVK